VLTKSHTRSRRRTSAARGWRGDPHRASPRPSDPKKFLESILLTLKNQGILVSRKGRGGGYALARPADQISFGEIVRLMDGPLAPVPCVSVTAYHACEECASEAGCEIRAVMKRVRDAISEVLDATTLADALRDGGLPGVRKVGRPAR
jgi:Rrf2 family protein